MSVMNWENVVDEMGEFCIVVRSMTMGNMLRNGLLADIYIESYEKLVDFTTKYEVCMVTLQGNFVRLLIHIKR